MYFVTLIFIVFPKKGFYDSSKNSFATSLYAVALFNV